MPLAVAPGTLVTPGECIYSGDGDVKNGLGTYRNDRGVISSVVGVVDLTKTGSDETVENNCIISVKSKQHEATMGQIIKVGTLCKGTVTRVTSNMTTLTLLTANDVVLTSPNSGVIRNEDVCSLIPPIENPYKLGDVVLARVISLGDSRQFFLSTSEDMLGVIQAVSERGGMMVPISWNEMECQETKVRERRKVARPCT